MADIIGNYVVSEIKLASRPAMCTHTFCPLKRLKLHFYAPTALWQRTADCHFAVGQHFSGRVWTGQVSKCSLGKGSKGHLRLGSAAPRPPGISITVPLNRFPFAPPGEALLSAF